MDGLNVLIMQGLDAASHRFSGIFAILLFLFSFVQAYWINEIATEQKLFPRPTHLPGMSYLLLTSLLPGWYTFTLFLPALTMLLLMLFRLCNIPAQQEARKSMFNIGLLIGLAACLYQPSALFLLLVLLAMLLYRPFIPAEWVLLFTGFFTPYYFIGAYIYLFDVTSFEWIHPWRLSLPAGLTGYLSWSVLGLGLLTAGIGFVFLQGQMRKLLVQSRKTWTLLFLFFLFSLFLPVMGPAPSFSYWLAAASVLAFTLASAYYYPDRTWFPILSHWGLVALSLLTGYFL